MRIISRQEASLLKLKRYFVNELCGRGHLSERYTLTGRCVVCRSRIQRKHYAKDVEKHRKRHRKYYEVNLDRERRRGRQRRQDYPGYLSEYRKKNLEKFREAGQRYRERYPEKHREKARADRKTSNGRFRMCCMAAAKALELSHLNHSRFGLLDYGSDEFITYLESTLPEGMSFGNARVKKYHIDHIIPLSFISKIFPLDDNGRKLAFRVAQDLFNLQMIPGNSNIRKGARIDLNSKQKTVLNYLSKKYSFGI